MKIINKKSKKKSKRLSSTKKHIKRRKIIKSKKGGFRRMENTIHSIPSDINKIYTLNKWKRIKLSS